MRLASAAVVIAILLLSASLSISIAYAQSNNNNNSQPFEVIKAERSESFSLPYSAANYDRKDPLVYSYKESKGQNWIMGIENTLSYVDREDAKVVVLLRDKAPSEKFIELHMYGDRQKKYSVWANVPEVGYSNIYLSEERGWSTDQPIGVSYSENGGLTLSDGKRTVVDRFGLAGFDLASIEVYGKDDEAALSNAYGGKLNISVIYGSPADTPVYFVPALVTAGMGVIVGLLLLVAKRKK